MRKSIHPTAVINRRTVSIWRHPAMPFSANRRILSLVLFLIYVGFSTPLFASVNFNAGWDYTEYGGEGRDTVRLFQQRYSYGFGIGKSLSYQPTSALTASAGIGYTRSQTNTSNGIYDIQHLSPSMQFSVANDIFLAQLSGSIGKGKVTSPSGSVSENTSKSWEATLASAWVIPLVPSLRLNTSRSNNTNAVIFKDIDRSVSTNSENNSMALDWDLILAHFYYSYTDQISADPADNLTESQSHFAKFTTGASLWEKRIRLSFSQQFQQSSQDFTLKASESGFYYLPVEGLARALVVDPALGTDPFTLPEPIDVTLDVKEKLTDGNYDDTALIVGNDQRMALSLTFDYSQQIDILRLTISTLLTKEQGDALQWNLYVKDPFGAGWELAAAGIPSAYDTIGKRFTLTVGRSEGEIMVVAVNNTGDSLEFVEFEAFSQRTESFGSTYTNRITSLGMGVKLAQKLSFSASLTRNLAENESGLYTNTVEYQSVSTHLGWTPIPSVTSSLGFSQNNLSSSGQTDSSGRSYTFNLSTIPLSSLNVIFGANRRDSFSGEQKTGTTYRYNLGAMARLYPDLSSNINLTTSKSRTFSGSGGLIGESTVLTGNFNLIAQLKKNVTANLSSNYTKTNRSSASDSETANAALNLQYRPSSSLSVHGSYGTVILGPGGKDSWNVGFDMALLRTQKTRLNLAANHSQTDRGSDSLTVNGGWDISKNLMFLGHGNLVVAEKYNYIFQASLKLKF